MISCRCYQWRNSVLLALVHTAQSSHGRALQSIANAVAAGDSILSSEITNQNTHKHVPALDIQSLMNIFGFKRKK